MSLLKQLNDAGIMCWFESKKNSNCFATATRPSFNITEQTSQNPTPKLQIFTFDVADKNLEPTLLGKTYIQQNATSITWTTFGEDSSQHPFGLIIIGTEDGSVIIYDAHQIIQSYKRGEHEKQVEIGKLAHIKEYNTPVNTIEYNSLKPNLIAMGAEDVLVVDISKDVTNPDIISPGEPNYHEGSIITSISWNKKVPHILASASNNGVAVVWNLKTSQVSFQINDNSNFQLQSQSQKRHLSLAWNPEIPLQFAITYDDEKKPELQIWDLRHPQGPVILLEEGHTKGIQTLTWCTSDPSLIITAGLDNKVVCWNVKNKQIVSQNLLDYEIINAQWSKIPSVYSIVSSSGQIQVLTLNSDSITAYPPKWYQPPVGATFAPNGNILYFSENTQQEIKQKILQKAQISQELQAALQELEIVIDDTNPSYLCEWKFQRIPTEDTFEQDQWQEEVFQTELVSKNINWDSGIERIIKENMIIGNYEGTIDCALKCGRVAEGLLIAYSKGEQAFKATMDEYFTFQTDSFIKQVFRNLIKDDINGLSEHYDLKSWRECAGLAITSAKNNQEFQEIMNKLGERFIDEKKDFQSAVCCFILAQNFPKLTQMQAQLPQMQPMKFKQQEYYYWTSPTSRQQLIKNIQYKQC
ncbi:hypothetical protein IMG5_192850 [Ichthyophthirius multifiliis]|uniref:Sec16 Sec23-binding domain-containing protein n=1 Tax=Ichthyophthirius multifiliis TaxID=5932 RepID=G0R4H9_ICHMU|nr:hypothetical protein IMG5_192850 [Ichthyophthirius multifiliis]EGR27630.1 hypothetical protein IMG5_192850 [Ichthyophthirius multifiliis]|eukprot:XP_004025082.1 hypothetical protein IMG5_192850 [Ichthyophthirius multifiliis]